MTDIRELLDGIEADLENPWKSVNVRVLLAALRAVLDLHQQSAVYPAYCHCEMPWPCVEYRAITEALGGGKS